MALEPRIEAIRKEYDLNENDFWQIKQNGQWVCKHAALEVVAHKAKVEWLAPQIIEARAEALVCSMIVTGKMQDRVEWSTGETNPTNYHVTGKQPSYPWAMAEKRAKDRVILKLVGIHGLVYSEAEADSFSDAPQATEKPVQPAMTYAAHLGAITSAATMDALKSAVAAANANKTLSTQDKADLAVAKDARKAALTKPADYVEPSFPGDA